eukprot:358532-Chlamydomonas_euryale.AAC.12
MAARRENCQVGSGGHILRMKNEATSGRITVKVVAAVAAAAAAAEAAAPAAATTAAAAVAAEAA